MRSLLVLLLDGLGDRAHPEHGGRTANEAADTPHLDALAARGSTGLLLPLGPGRAPSSEVAHWAILGYRPPEFPGRAVLEARGHGLRPSADAVLAFAALRSTEPRDGALWATGRAGAGDGPDARVLLESLPRTAVGGLTLELHPTRAEAGEGILALAGGAHDGVTDSDPFFRDRHPLLRPRPTVPEAAATARAAELWSRAVLRALARHPVNAARRRDGRRALDAVTLKWWGRPRPAPTFRARHGLDGVLVGASPFLAGLAETLGMRAVHAPEGADPAAALRDRLDRARSALDGGATFVFCHLKATDEAGHTKDPAAKRRTIEAVRRGPRGPRGALPRRGGVRHGRPRHPHLGRGDPLGRPGARPPRRPRRARGPRDPLRRAGLRRGTARAADRRRRHAGAPERRRPAPLPGLAPHPGALPGRSADRCRAAPAVGT